MVGRTYWLRGEDQAAVIEVHVLCLLNKPPPSIPPGDGTRHTIETINPIMKIGQPPFTSYLREYLDRLLGPLPGQQLIKVACGNSSDRSINAFTGTKIFAYDVRSAREPRHAVAMIPAN